MAVTNTSFKNIEAEKAVIGGILKNPPDFFKVTEILKTDDFVGQETNLIFQAIEQIVSKKQKIDKYLIAEILKDQPVFKKVTVQEFLENLPHPIEIEPYIELVKQASIYRGVYYLSSQEIEVAQKKPSNGIETLEELVKKKFDLLRQNNRKKDGITHVSVITDKVLEKAVELEHFPNASKGIRCGIERVDDLCGGFQPKDLITFAAPSNHGKTAITLNMAAFMALKLKKKIVYFSLEMTKASLTERLIASVGKVDYRNIQQGHMTPEEWVRYIHAKKLIDGSGIYIIDDLSPKTTNNLRHHLEQYTLQHGNVDCVFIDYLGCMSAAKKENKNLEVASICHDLKDIASEFNCPIVLLSQLSRANSKRPDPKPIISDLRDSGEIEHISDYVLLMSLDIKFSRNEEDRNKATLFVAKTRNGMSEVTVPLAFFGQYQQFENLLDENNHY